MDEKEDELPKIRSLWDFQKPVETRRRFEDLLPRVAGDEHREFRLEVMTQIGRTFGLEGKFEEAHRTLDEVETQLGGSGALVRCRYLLGVPCPWSGGGGGTGIWQGL